MGPQGHDTLHAACTVDLPALDDSQVDLARE